MSQNVHRWWLYCPIISGRHYWNGALEAAAVEEMSCSNKNLILKNSFSGFSIEVEGCADRSEA